METIPPRVLGFFFIAEVRYGAYRRICSCKFNRFNVQIKIAFKCQAKGGIGRFLFCIQMTLGGIALQGWIWQKCHERGARLSKIRAKNLISTCKICTCVHCFGDAKPSPPKNTMKGGFLGNISAKAVLIRSDFHWYAVKTQPLSSVVYDLPSVLQNVPSASPVRILHFSLSDASSHLCLLFLWIQCCFKNNRFHAF